MTLNPLTIHEAMNLAASMQPLVNAEYIDANSNSTYTVRSICIFPYDEYERLHVANLYYQLIHSGKADAPHMVELFLQTNPISDFDVVVTAAPKDDMSPDSLYITSLLPLACGSIPTKKPVANLP